MGYIVPSPKSQKYYYGGFFQELKTDLEIENCIKVAGVAKSMAKDHLGSFCFLSNYLFLSCLELIKGGIPISKVEERYEVVIKTLQKLYPPVPLIENKNHILDIHSNFKDLKIVPKIEIDLSTSANKQDTLDQFIWEQAI